MKKIYILIALAAFVFSSCNDKWSEYYFGAPKGEVQLSITITEFFNGHPEYSKYYEMLKKTGLDKELTKDQQITIWVVKNEGMDVSGITDTDTLRMKYHMNYLPLLQSDLKSGLRVRSLNGIYFQITKNTDGLFANNSQITKSFRLNNGVVHELNSLMKSKINMYDYLKQLGSDYSIIRDSIFKYNVQLFDRANSIPVSVDKTGNTVYDSVFYVSNPLFATVPFNSEFSQFTAFLPNNQVITNCFNELNAQYQKMGKVVSKSDTILAFTWIKQAMFYNGTLTQTNLSAIDINSAFGKVWRTTIQQLDLNNPVELSNGRLFNVTKIKIPNNVIITKIKSLVEYWEYQEKVYPDPADLYVFKGMVGTPSTFVDSATPKPAVLPNYITLNISGNTATTDEFSMEFPPLEKYVENGVTKVRVMEVPTGEYNLYMGFHSAGHPFVDIFFNDVQVNTQGTIAVDLSTPWNFDRVNETDKDLNPISGIAKWDGLGGPVGVVHVVRADGEAGLASFRIKVKFNALEAAGGVKSLRVYHWALKPTANNY
ncbi:MAG: fasciclin domain-containing protein [Paludibacter sp.]|nr:fasciclin domain-containing protein [Paludibacter sp.]